MKQHSDCRIDFINAIVVKIAATVNTCTENIGARRLHTIIEKLFEDLFAAIDAAKK